MTSLHQALAGSNADAVRIKTALISVSDKDGVIEFVRALVGFGCVVISTGGTAGAIKQAGLPCTDVASFTGQAELFDGRVKTLHPKIHGAILAVRGNSKHEEELLLNGIQPIDLVVTNLYPFEHSMSSGEDFDTCVENIDVGGPCLLRAAAKNHRSVCVLSSPSQYASFLEALHSSHGSTSYNMRRALAAEAFALTCRYDSHVATFFAAGLGAGAGAGAGAGTEDKSGPATAALQTQEAEKLQQQQTQGGLPISRSYSLALPLKYGCNPHQREAGIYRINDQKLPFSVVNGNPGYINILDAAFGWQLVKELQTALKLPAAASFKHCSPAGAAVAVPLTPDEVRAYGCEAVHSSLSPLAIAYLRARNADPMSSYGDFAAVSGTVDESLADLLRGEVCDGIIAAGYTPRALDILRAKKKGSFIMLVADDADYAPTPVEMREVFGFAFAQRRNDATISTELLKNIVTGAGAGAGAALPGHAERDLVLACIVMKYTQSNSVGYALNGQMIGVGAGQQSRVDCVKLAAHKARVWYLRMHPKVQALPFKPGLKRQDRVNARVRYIEGDFTPTEALRFSENFNADEQAQITALTSEESEAFLRGLKDVCLASDGFFPFRDSIDHASRAGVRFVAQPGGSVADPEVRQACSELGVTMVFTGLRLFHH